MREHWQTGGTVSVNLARHALALGVLRGDLHVQYHHLRPHLEAAFLPRTWQHKLKLRQRKIRSKKQKKVIGFYLDFL